jgi:hypothetical protein
LNILQRRSKRPQPIKVAHKEATKGEKAEVSTKVKKQRHLFDLSLGDAGGGGSSRVDQGN